MTWYLWVWGGACSVAMLLWGVVGFVVLREALEKRWNRATTYEGLTRTIALREAQLEVKDVQIRKLQQRIREAESGVTQFGRVCP